MGAAMRGRGKVRRLGPLALILTLFFLGLPPLPAVPAAGASGLFAPAPELAPKAQLPLWGWGFLDRLPGARPLLRRSPAAPGRRPLSRPRPERRRYLRLGRLLLEGG